MTTRTTKKPPAPTYRVVCVCDHCRELAAVSPGLAMAFRWPHPHTCEANDLIAAARDVARRRAETC